MKYIKKEFSNIEIDLLKCLKGKRINTIDAMLVAPPDISWNTVRLHCDGIDVDINNYLTNVLLDDWETADEIGFLALNKASKEVLNIPEVGTDTTVI